MEISTREVPVQPWGEDADSGYVLFPVLGQPGRYVAQFGDGSYSSAWVPKGAELDELSLSDAPPRPVAERLLGRFSAEQFFVFGVALTVIGAASNAFS